MNLLRFNSIFGILYQTEPVESGWFQYQWCFSTRGTGICDMYRLGIQRIYWLLSFVKVFISFRYQKIWLFTQLKDIWIEILKYETPEVRSEARWWRPSWRGSSWWWWWWCPAWPARRSGASMECTEIPTHQSIWQGTISVPRGKREFLLIINITHKQQYSNLT